MIILSKSVNCEKYGQVMKEKSKLMKSTKTNY